MKENFDELDLVALKRNLTKPSAWIRVLFMALFAFILVTIVYTPVKYAVILLIFFQIGSVLFTGKLIEPVLMVSKSLSIYIFQILSYLTYNTNEKPFPFSAWPTGYNVVIVPFHRQENNGTEQVVVPPPPRRED